MVAGDAWRCDRRRDAVPPLKEEKDLYAWKGKLAGKIVLYGKTPSIHPDPEPLLQVYDENKLLQIFHYPLDGDMSEQHVFVETPADWEKAFKKIAFQEKVAHFFADQHAAAVLVPGWEGEGGTIRDDNSEELGEFSFRPDHKQPIASAVLSSENFGRVGRLLEHAVPVTISVAIHSEFTGDHEQGYNTIAEIPGTDATLKDQVVMVGGHLDSWIAGTGATDDGAGVIVAMEAMRILNALHVQPRRTIRVALWTGEEQGDIGSGEYVRQHFAAIGMSTAAEQLVVPEFLREPVGPLTAKPEHALISGYFNLDNGGGKLLGIYAENNAAAVATFKQWIAPLQDLGVTTVSMRKTGSTDHESFDRVGIPGFQFIQDPRDYETRSLHSNQDVYERLSPSDLKQAAVVEAIFVYNTAMRDQMLPRKPLPRFDKEKAPLKVPYPGAVDVPVKK